MRKFFPLLLFISISMRSINYTGIYSFDIYTNITAPNIEETITPKFDMMMILQLVIATIGVIANSTVAFAFLNHKQFRRKTPNKVYN